MSTRVEDSHASLARQTFVTTQWTEILVAGRTNNAAGDAALEKLCRTYWSPLYAFVRRRGYDLHEAQDLTQGFFERLLEKDFMRSVDRNKGKFRSFLLAALDHFLAKDWRRARAQKRGGKMAFISLDDDSPERQYLQVASRDLSPEQVFEQQWALTLLNEVLAQLQKEFTEAGKKTVFEETKVFLTGEKRDASCAQLAARLGTTEAALKMTVSRMRRRYRELLRAEVARTVGSPEEIDTELRALSAALSL